jgi:hypothetical protein
MVSHLYNESYGYLGQSLDPEEKEFYESICFNSAPAEHWGYSLQQLTYFLARKSGRGVMVFIDEYEAPYRYAYEYGFVEKVRSSYRSRLPSRLRTVIKANEFFGGVLSALLKVIMM